MARAALILCVLAAASCRCRSQSQDAKGESIEVGRITVSWVDVVDEFTVERDEVKEKRLRKILASRVKAHDRITPGVAGRDPLELSVVSGGEVGEQIPEMASADAFTDPGAEILASTLSTTWGDGWRISSSVLTDLEMKDLSALEPVLDDLLSDLVDQLDLFEKDSTSIVALLDERDCRFDGVCATAVRILGERKEASSVPTLVKILQEIPTSDPLTEDLIGALGRIGDERASKALVETFNKARPSQQVAIIESLASTGGPDARLFLEVVATGHESVLVREQATRALARLESR
jgi:hypothetical protein